MPKPRRREPTQPRSAASLRRLVRAASRLLETRSFDQLSIQQIVKAARSSVGVFYSRFADKHALLEYLDELYAEDLRALHGELGDAWSGAPTTVAQRVRDFVRVLVVLHREQRGVIRAVVLHARSHPGGSFGRRTTSTLEDASRFLARLATGSTEREPSPAALAAHQLAFVCALSLIREQILFPEGPASLAPLDDDTLAKLVARQWLTTVAGVGS